MNEVAFMPNDFTRVACVHKVSDTLSCTRNGRVHFAAFRVASPPLHIALKEMLIHRVQYDLWDLRTRSVCRKR